MEGPIHGCLGLFEKFLPIWASLRADGGSASQSIVKGIGTVGEDWLLGLPGPVLCVGPDHRVCRASGNDLESTYTMIPKRFPRR